MNKDKITGSLPIVDDRSGQAVQLKAKFDRYQDGGISIQVTDEDGMPYAKATLNVGSDEDRALMLADNLVAIKDYSENEGMEKLLLKNNIIQEGSMGTLDTGQVAVNVYRLSQASLDIINKAPLPKIKF